MTALAEAVLAGDRRALARLLTLIENTPLHARPDLAALYPHTGRAHIVGVTGAPGSGKSTLVNRLAIEWRSRRCTVGILAVDPSSPFSGGAILGDRIRMHEASGDAGVFIRSMATRGALGGLTRATSDAIRALDASGRDVVLVETVGVGQDEIDVARTAHTTIVIQTPTMGDDIQMLKAGIIEIADILVINKADLPGAERVQAALEMLLDTGATADGWRPPIIPTVATQGQGVAVLCDAIERHRSHLLSDGGLEERQQQRTREDIMRLLGQELLTQTLAELPPGVFDEMVQRVARRELDPYGAVKRIMEVEGDR
jgi:LAO/AO transport system kinase